MKELQELIAAWQGLPDGAEAVLATVVATTGSTYRKPGARMLITRSGWAAGSVSGGCLEGDVLSTAWERTEQGPTLVTYDSTSDDDIVWGFGLGCQGSVTVLFQRLGASGVPLCHIAHSISRREYGVLATVIGGDGLGTAWYVTGDTAPAGPIEAEAARRLATHRTTIEVVDGRDVLFESLEPPIALTVFGAGHDAIPLVRAAKAMAWHVTVVDHRPAFADPHRFPEADRVLAVDLDADPRILALEPGGAVVVMTHNYLTDVAILRRMLGLPLRYIGQLGPSARTNRMLADLAREGVVLDGGQASAFHAPIGLDLGGSSPEEIALAVIAEIQAAVHGKAGAMLTGHTGPLHEPMAGGLQAGAKESVTCPASP